jgi:hypothetical protein
VLPAVNYPPVITSQPPLSASTALAYSYQVTATDPDNDTQTYSLSTTYNGGNGPTINATTGLVSWATPVAGTYQFTVTDTDAGGLMAVQYYDLAVELDTAPTITSTAVTSVTASLPYRYDVQASDSDGDPLTYALSGAPSWLSIDQNGRITGSPGVAQIGTYSGITVTVADQFGSTAVPLPEMIAAFSR